MEKHPSGIKPESWLVSAGRAPEPGAPLSSGADWLHCSLLSALARAVRPTIIAEFYVEFSGFLTCAAARKTCQSREV